MTVPLHYRLNKKISGLAMWVLNLATLRSADAQVDLRQRPIRKILLVRANFRLGDSLLATPAILLFRRNFPHARIDFVGSSIAKVLFQNLSMDHHYQIARCYPDAWWPYLRLIREIRSVGYDLAVDVSCSQSAMGAVIVGFSGARLRAGLRGRRDHWYNIRIPRPAEKNKYRTIPALVAALGLQSCEVFPSLALSPAEKTEGARRIGTMVELGDGPVVGVFVGGRISVGKRWPARCFLQLVAALQARGLRVAAFVGPEEKDLIGLFKERLGRDVPVVYEPSPRIFAAMVARCDLFVTGDGGPMHLACAVGVRTVAIFLKPDYGRWGPPPSLGRIICQAGGPSAGEVLEVCLQELSQISPPSRSLERLEQGGVSETARRSTLGRVVKDPSSPLSVRDLSLSLKMSRFKQRVFSFIGYTQVLFFVAVIIYAWFFPPSGIFAEGTWTEAFTDSFGIGSLLAGGFLRFWAVSHAGKHNLSRSLKTPMLVTTGPYAYIRHPIYTGDFLTGLGMIFLSEAFSLTPLFVALFALQDHIITSAEERFLKEKFGEEFDLFRLSVPKYLPRVMPRTFSLGRKFPLKELGVVWGIILAGFFVEWIESPLHRTWLAGLYHWLVR